jgi:tubulin gamma
MGPLGRLFMLRCKALGRPLVAWTVNDPKHMRWCIKHGLNGIISDDPGLLVRIRDEYDLKIDHKSFSIRDLVRILGMNMLCGFIGFIFVAIFGFRIDRKAIKIALAAQPVI